MDGSVLDEEKLKYKTTLKRPTDHQRLSLTAVDINESLEVLVAAFENGSFYVFSLIGIEYVFNKLKAELTGFVMMQWIKA